MHPKSKKKKTPVFEDVNKYSDRQHSAPKKKCSSTIREHLLLLLFFYDLLNFPLSTSFKN
jgi:hypothetical protein